MRKYLPPPLPARCWQQRDSPVSVCTRWAAQVMVDSKEARDHGIREVGLPSTLASFSKVPPPPPHPVHTHSNEGIMKDTIISCHPSCRRKSIPWRIGPKRGCHFFLVAQRTCLGVAHSSTYQRLLGGLYAKSGCPSQVRFCMIGRG